MIFKSSFGMIKDNYLMLYKWQGDVIVLDTITEIKICERKASQGHFINYFKKRMYDFTIIIDNHQEVKFSFSKKSLTKAMDFKKRILHTQFSLHNSVSQNTTPANNGLDYRF
ncbi:hypothetical protein [Flavobacterium sp. XGLA_31]|uniref:hypothetical protein n=1 Tax=Flavobacterium sp. XGLA_31 TaxID=3447666 RepID=UPI003F40F4B8